MHRADSGGDPVDRSRRSHRHQGRGPARGLFRRARNPVPAGGLHDRAVFLAVCADEAASRQGRACHGHPDGDHRHRLPDRLRDQHQHLAAGDFPRTAKFRLGPVTSGPAIAKLLSSQIAAIAAAAFFERTGFEGTADRGLALLQILRGGFA